MLHARAAVEIEVLLDLGFPFSLGRLVDRELDPARSVRHHLRHERGVFGRDVLVVEMLELAEPHDVAVVGDVAVHVPQRHVPDHVVDVEERAGLDPGAGRAIAGKERALVVRPVDEGVDRVTVGGDRRPANHAVLVLDVVGLLDRACAAFRGALPRPVDVLDVKRDVPDAVPVPLDVVRDRTVRAERRGQDQPDLPLLEHVRGAVSEPRLEAAVRRGGEPEGVRVVVRRLLRVPDVELDVVGPADLQEVVRGTLAWLGLGRRGAARLRRGCAARLRFHPYSPRSRVASATRPTPSM